MDVLGPKLIFSSRKSKILLHHRFISTNTGVRAAPEAQENFEMAPNTSGRLGIFPIFISKTLWPSG